MSTNVSFQGTYSVDGESLRFFALATARVVSIEYEELYESPQRATTAGAYRAFSWDVQQGRALTAADLLVDHDGDGGAAAWQALRGPILDALAVHFQGDYTRSQLDSVELDGPDSEMMALTPVGPDIGLSKCEIFDCATGGALINIPYDRLGGSCNRNRFCARPSRGLRRAFAPA